ncbi:MAG: protein kinase, partial [Oscillospiraceae bacterium]|nr:protein kinase [Oscillospiraceae bacterium]
MKEYLCMGCMENKGTAEVCPHCGYAENAPRIQHYLAPRSLLNGRYIVGRVLSYNGEGVTYMGYDAVLERRVEIREYFPDTLVTRGSDGCSVLVRQGCQIPFKANMSDFIELMSKLSRIRAFSCLQQVWDVTEANGTVYAVQEHMNGTLLRELLDRRQVMFTWGEAVDLLLPVVKTLDMIHQEGLIHRGVSPATIWLGHNGTVKLGGFCISAVRAARTELAAELFPGFAAPEQYSAVSPHGTWTDVYAVSALLYTCVTGKCPPEALIRSARELAPPRECNETVSPRISLAILQGLS